MALVNVSLSCTGTIHDHDWGFWDTDEEESYSFAEVIQLNAGGAERSWSREKTVDGEVQLKVNLSCRMSTQNVLTIWGTLELHEGGVYWTLDASASIPATHIGLGQNVTLYNNKLENSGGDWASANLRAEVATSVQQPALGPSFNIGAPSYKPGDALPQHGNSVVVVSESPTGRNLGFLDVLTGNVMSRRVFVDAITQGFYGNYDIRYIDGIATPVSKPNDSTSDNLG